MFEFYRFLDYRNQVFESYKFLELPCTRERERKRERREERSEKREERKEARSEKREVRRVKSEE